MDRRQNRSKTISPPTTISHVKPIWAHSKCSAKPKPCVYSAARFWLGTAFTGRAVTVTLTLPHSHRSLPHHRGGHATCLTDIDQLARSGAVKQSRGQCYGQRDFPILNNRYYGFPQAVRSTLRDQRVKKHDGEDSISDSQVIAYTCVCHISGRSVVCAVWFSLTKTKTKTKNWWKRKRN